MSDEIVYADHKKPSIKVCDVRPLMGYKLLIRFNTGETKMFDCSPLLEAPAFEPLSEEIVFRCVTIEHGVVVWDNGSIDLAPEFLYHHSLPADDECT